MKTVVYIDNNIWDFLFDQQMNLCVELPDTEYTLCITREAEFEITPIPLTKAAKKLFIEQTIKTCCVEARPYIGFYNHNHSKEEQRIGPLGVGRLASREEGNFMKSQKHRLGKEKKSSTRLYKNEADISLAARSLTSVVLSFDDKPGPLRDAFNNGGKVVFLRGFDRGAISLNNYIKTCIKDRS